MGRDVFFTVRQFSLLAKLSSILPHFYYYPTKDPSAIIIPEMARLVQNIYVNLIFNDSPNGGEDLKWPGTRKNYPKRIDQS